jgi:hypothetical protein
MVVDRGLLVRGGSLQGTFDANMELDQVFEQSGRFRANRF